MLDFTKLEKSGGFIAEVINFNAERALVTYKFFVFVFSSSVPSFR